MMDNHRHRKQILVWGAKQLFFLPYKFYKFFANSDTLQSNQLRNTKVNIYKHNTFISLHAILEY